MKLTGVTEAEVLAALYNNAKVQGMGIFQADNAIMTVAEAQEILNKSTDKYFDYLKGRVMKIKISAVEVDTFLYNRDNGQGAAEKVLEKLMFKMQ